MTLDEIKSLANDELAVLLSNLDKQEEGDQEVIIRESACRLLGKSNNGCRFFTVEGAKEAFRKEFCKLHESGCKGCPFQRGLKLHLGEREYCFERWMVSNQGLKRS